MVPVWVKFIRFEEIYILKIVYLNFQNSKKYGSIPPQRIFPKVVRPELMQNFIKELTLIWGQTSTHSFHFDLMPADFWTASPCGYAAQGCVFPEWKHGTPISGSP